MPCHAISNFDLSGRAAIKACLSQLLNCNYTLDFYLYYLVSKSWRAKFYAWLRTFPCSARAPVTGASCIAEASTSSCPQCIGRCAVKGHAAADGGGLQPAFGQSGGRRDGRTRPTSPFVSNTAHSASVAPAGAPAPSSCTDSPLLSIGVTDNVVPPEGDGSVQLRQVLLRKSSDKSLTTPVQVVVTDYSNKPAEKH